MLVLDYSKLPSSPPVDEVFLLDPLVATGGTVCAALAMIVDWGIPGECPYQCKGLMSKHTSVSSIKLLCILASSQGLSNVQSEYPDLEVNVYSCFRMISAQSVRSGLPP